MKTIYFLLLFLATTARAQTFAEWFQQNKTQKKYYRAQIAALQVYTGAVEKGYAILETGLAAIRNLQSGEFDLHKVFYDRLSGINPAIGKMGEETEIVSLETAVAQRCADALRRYRQNHRIDAGEFDYISQVYGVILDAGQQVVDLLQDLLTAGRLKLSDDERMERI